MLAPAAPSLNAQRKNTPLFHCIYAINFNSIAVKFGFVKGYPLFSGTDPLGHTNRAGGSPLTGGEFFAEPQRGDSPSADGGDVAAPAAGAKRKGHLRFPFLFELLPFPCWDSLGADGRLRKQEKDAAVGLLLRVFLRLFAVHRQRTATQAGYSTQSAA